MTPFPESTLTSEPTPSLSEPQTVGLKDVVVSHELLTRPVRKIRARAEVLAMHELAKLFPQGSPLVFTRLAQMAVELCDADAGGISMLEDTNDGRQIFRWIALAGTLKSYVGGTTPREWSPCGECLNAGRPMLYSYPGRFFTYFQKVDPLIVEGLVIPMADGAHPVGTIWVVSSHEGRKFDAEDVRVMTGLGSFATAAVRLSLRKRAQGADEPEERDLVWCEFVRRIACGDHSALESLIEETRPSVFARVLKILGCPADAEEATGDVYSQVWRSAGRYDSQRQCVWAWLLNIARSRSLDRLRMRTRHGRIEVALSLPANTGSDPETSASCAETANQIRRAMQALPFEQSRVIQLAYFQGHSVAEIASRLGHPLGTVKTRLRTALSTLRLILSAGKVTVSLRPSSQGCTTAGVRRTRVNVAG